MVAMSRFTHVFDFGKDVALYHSLRMKPVYLTKETYETLCTWLQNAQNGSIEDSPQDISAEVSELAKYKILVRAADEDDRVLQFVRSKIPAPATNVCYMILSEQCNLACKYCFLGNNDEVKRKNFLLENMSEETADKALDFFIRQIKASGLDTETNEPVLIFYGGEPLINFEVLEHVAERVNSLRESVPCIKNMEMSMVSNGLLLTEDRILRLQELGVGIAISIDGFTVEANQMRVDRAGNKVFPRILEKLDLCKKLGVDVSLSVTISEETLKNEQDVLRLIDEYNIKGLGFNIMMSDEKFTLPQSYNEAAAQFIIDEFVELRKRGIYEDRIMRKLKSFSKAQVYFSDCAATAGGQIVIAPNGRVGICHGCLFDKEYFVATIDDDDFIAIQDPNFLEWSQLTPLNHEECYDCQALGICGGGCPINARNLKPENTIHSIDERFCVHAKKTLEFFIADLYRIILKNRAAQ
ncbi:FibroRumin system radical SAM peptide maturase [Atopobium sp. oral taxon 810]|uniref:FibroRumin system radical SAM peptide maturase n=1 Tax=Atopobium sp. oral taxon 810 TaxID=712158 RepID=UPI0003984605|nr:FibroRumin system radical SAM peptide maturase [Atopobium sp. oral taxon 810]ERI04019.1 radical SAM domain protein [Atopobium sp. oral taxon 810 str. F0209]DAW07913.1 MAG TPA: radical SAM peptide maturase, FibroRumin system [Caudoviricetes sp.]